MSQCGLYIIVLFIMGPPAPPTAPEPENERLSGDAFRMGLKKLGLTDLLDFYVREFPPQDAVEAALLKRELRLNLYADPAVSTAERLRALDEATQMLRDLLRDHPDHEAAYAWRLELGRDLIERQAEPYRNNILLRGGSAADREKLAQLAGEALLVYDRLIQQLTEEEARIDDLSISQFEKSAKTGQIERIEALLPKARYFRMWASYYRCLALGGGGANLHKALADIVAGLTDELKLTTIEHRYTHTQAQALLLAGMTYRLLNSPDRAEDSLSRAISVANAVSDFAERHNLRWVVTTATLERAKNFRDTGQYQSALRLLDEYRAELPENTPNSFDLRFAVALIEGTIHRAEANALPAGENARRAELLFKSRQPLIHLARQQPGYQDEVYAELFKLLGDVDDPAALDPFEKSVLLAGLLRRVREIKDQTEVAGAAANGAGVVRLRQERRQLLEKASTMARSLIAENSELAVELRPEARFNLAVCLHEQGQVLEAIGQFNQVVQDHPEFARSRSAAEYAVRLAESAYDMMDADAGARKSIRSVYLMALRGLISNFRDSDAARSRRFTYARVLQEDGDFEEAARQYGLVPADDPRACEALFHVAECHFNMLRQLTGSSDRDRLETQVVLTRQSAERFQERATGSQAPGLARYIAESRLISAETELLSQDPKPDRALEFLADFEVGFAQEPDRLGRAMRIRILAYQRKGDLSRAAAIIPEYMGRDPRYAGAVLQDLLRTFNEEITQARKNQHHDQARKAAQDALLVARSLYEWSATAAGLDVESRRAVELEYGEALLRAEQQEQALEVFRVLLERVPDKRWGGRALLGLAEAYFALRRYPQALQQFNLLFQHSSENSELWWKAFLGEVECRRVLDQEPEILYNLISQKRVFFPNMGGADMKEQFDRMQAELAAKR